jgi:hypothetical protein
MIGTVDESGVDISFKLGRGMMFTRLVKCVLIQMNSVVMRET